MEKNRLIVTLAGFISEREAWSIKETVLKETPRLKTGFSVINDISHFRAGQDEAGQILKDVIKYLMSHKVEQVVRVVGASQMAVIQFANSTGKMASYNVKYVPTMEDAELLLEKKSPHPVAV